MTEPTVQAIELPVTFDKAEDTPITYATNVFVQFLPHTFLITFAQLHGPYQRRALTPEALETLKEEGLPARVVARLSIPPDRWKEMLGAFNSNYAKWEAVYGAAMTQLLEQGLSVDAPDEEEDSE
jgi:hypothetical protein